MKRLSVAFVFVLSVFAIVGKAEAQPYCYVRFSSDLISYGGYQDQYQMWMDGSTWTFNSNPGSYSTWWSCGGVNFTETRSWVEGRQPNGFSSCEGNGYTGLAQQQYGVCSRYWPGANNIQASMFYSHPIYLSGSWGGTTQHFYNDRMSQIYRSRYYTMSGAVECGQRGAPWYWDGSDCVDGGGSPILLPMRGTRLDFSQYKLTDVLRGVQFDIDGDGVKEQMAWTEAGSNLAFLWTDRNGNGVVDNGTELYGNHTVAGAQEGFTALYQIMAQADDGRLNAIDAADPLYEKLLLWEDRNHDGVSQKSEIASFGDVYASIGTGSSVEPQEDAMGNRGIYRGWAEQRTRQDRLDRAQSGKEHTDRLVDVWDVFLKVQ